MTCNTAYILTNQAEPYQGLLDKYGKTARFFGTVDALNRALVKDDQCCGLLLDVHMVMRAPAEERNRLFALSRQLPFIRTRTNGSAVEMLDGPVSMEAIGSDRPGRQLDRAKVRLDAQYADFRDPFMTDPQEAVVLDISLGGCFAHLPHGLPKHDYLHLKILEMAVRRPIHCAVRWRRDHAAPGTLTGLGLKFIDISQEQLDEIQQHLLK